MQVLLQLIALRETVLSVGRPRHEPPPVAEASSFNPTVFGKILSRGELKLRDFVGPAPLCPATLTGACVPSPPLGDPALLRISK